MQLNEKKLKETLKPYYDSARAGDWEHVNRVAGWTRELGENRDDIPLLIVAAYIHDIGWSGVAPKGKLDLDHMLNLEAAANKNSPKLIEEILPKLDFNKNEIETIKRLVVAADRHQPEQEDEAIIVDADSLSKLCTEHLEEKYQPDSFQKVIVLWEAKLATRINTEKGKKLFKKLLKELKQSI